MRTHVQQLWKILKLTECINLSSLQQNEYATKYNLHGHVDFAV